jgi:PPOX class probable F420-dependent enzyme
MWHGTVATWTSPTRCRDESAVTEAEARGRFAAARVAVLATVEPSRGPHLVPVTFVVDGDTVWSAVDDKPKRSTPLRRHVNIRREPRVSLLVHHWDEDWSRLWWVRADGTATLGTEAATVERVTGLLRGKYRQYAHVAVAGPVIEVTVEVWRGWAAAA